MKPGQFKRKIQEKITLISLKNKARYKSTSVSLDGLKISSPDSLSLFFQYNEIFKKKIYQFQSDTSSPFIIDGGANIGLSVLFFNKIFPHSEIIAFEADPNIYTFLEKNVADNLVNNTTLINKALWSENTTMHFEQEGADAGRIRKDASSIIVDTCRLSTFMNRKVDFLKLDIEGAEIEVLEEAKSKLGLVERIFIEYHSFAGQDQHLQSLLEIMRKSGFRYYISSPGLTQPHPFIHIETYAGMDMQINVYGVRP